MDLEERLRSIRNEAGLSVYDHIMNIIGKILLTQESQPYERFEQLSVEVRSQNHYLGFSPEVHDLIREEGKNFTGLVESMRRFLKLQTTKPADDTNEDGKPSKEDESPQLNIFSNVIEQESISSRCGVSVGETKAFLIQNALKAFSALRGGQKCSFWGIIHAAKCEYYIFESPTATSHSVTEDTEESRKDTVDEHNGIGINLKYYFVMTNLLSEKWEELPAISAKQLRQARALRYIFTGDLRRPIIASPEFAGEERHYVA